MMSHASSLRFRVESGIFQCQFYALCVTEEYKSQGEIIFYNKPLKWLLLLLHIRGVTASILGPEINCTDQSSSYLLSAHPGKCLDIILNQATTIPLHIILNNFFSYHAMLCSVTKTRTISICTALYWLQFEENDSRSCGVPPGNKFEVPIAQDAKWAVTPASIVCPKENKTPPRESKPHDLAYNQSMQSPNYSSIYIYIY